MTPMKMMNLHPKQTLTTESRVIPLTVYITRKQVTIIL